MSVSSATSIELSMSQLNLDGRRYLRPRRPQQNGSRIGDELASYQGARNRRGKGAHSSAGRGRARRSNYAAVMDPDASDEMIDHLVDFFDEIAPVYDSWAGGQHARVAARLVELAKPKRGEHALDVGTGTGLVAHLVAAKINPGLLIGIDLSDRMLSIARSTKAKNVQFLGMAAERLVF